MQGKRASSNLDSCRIKCNSAAHRRDGEDALTYHNRLEPIVKVLFLTSALQKLRYRNPLPDLYSFTFLMIKCKSAAHRRDGEDALTHNDRLEPIIKGYLQHYDPITLKHCKRFHRSQLAQNFERPPRLDILLNMPPASREVQIQHAWNPEDRSPNIYVSKSNKLLCKKHAYGTTGGIRGKVGFTQGLHAWEVHWRRYYRLHSSVVGVATAEAPLQSKGHQILVGSNDLSWGWDLSTNTLCHNLKRKAGVTYPTLKPKGTISVPDKILVVLDMDEGTLSYVVKGENLGIAFRGLEGKKLYPVISSACNFQATMKYIGGLNPVGPLPLISLCRLVIRQHIGEQRLEEHVANLNLPRVMKNFLLYRDVIVES